VPAVIESQFNVFFVFLQSRLHFQNATGYFLVFRSVSAWIRVKLNGRMDPDPDQSDKPERDLHRSDKLDPDSHQFAEDKPKCMEYERI
jgi:hypothetical protein